MVFIKRDNPLSKEDINLSLEIFKKFLKEKGYRVTKERELIAQEIMNKRGHFDVDELFIQLRNKNSISKASIYRTIPLLIEAGLLAAVYLANGHMHYERIVDSIHHSHLFCTSCKHIFEFSSFELDNFAKNIAQEKGFLSEGYKFEIWGICSQCQK